LAGAAIRFVRRRAGARDDRGDIILGWFIRVAVFLLFLGILAFEGLSLVTARINGTDLAQQAAGEAAEAFQSRRTEEAAYAAAEEFAIEHDAELNPDKFVVSTDGAVDLEIKTTATTLFLFRTDATAKWAVVRSSAHANPRPH
jgi:hypothetical protein